MSEPFEITKFHITQDQYSYLHSVFHEKAGVKDLETYFEGYSSIPTDDPGAILSDRILEELELHFDQFLRSTSFNETESASDFVIISMAVDPTRKHRLQEKFTAMSVIDEMHIQACQMKIFEEMIESDLLDSLKTVY